MPPPEPGAPPPVFFAPPEPVESGPELDLFAVKDAEPVVVEPSAAAAAVLPLSEVEKRAILDALISTKGNRTRAADLLGISIRTLRNKLNEYRIDEGVPAE